MNDLQIFSYQSHEVRKVEVNGEPWFVLKDVCEILHMDTAQLKKVADRLDEDEKGRTQITTPGGEQETWIVNESGLYSVLLRSDKPEAKPLRKWVTSEVLPQIRKTGSYSIAPKMDSLQALNLLVQSLNAQQDAMNRLQVNVDAQSAAIEKLEEQSELNRQAFTMNPGNWRENATAVVGSIVLKKTGGETKGSGPVYEEVWNEIYDMMKLDFHKDMKKRKMNLKKEFPKRKFSNLEVIDRAGDRNQLISVLQSVLCKMCIRYGVRLDMDRAKIVTNKSEDGQTSMFDRNCAPAGRLVDAREVAVRG